MVKIKHILIYISIFFIFGIFIVWYQDKRINNYYPSYVKEFLDNPTFETEKKLDKETYSLESINSNIASITTRLSSIERINLEQDKEINENTITVKKAAVEISDLQNKIKKTELELEEAMKSKKDY
jgi:hypothetical protein